MLKIVTLFSAATLSLLPQMVFADSFPLTTFEHDGRIYVYQVTESNGIRTIEGKEITSRKPFTLVVGRHSVSGTVDGTPVSFKLRDVQPLAAGTAEVAAR